MTSRTPKQIADDIMDSACLGEPYIRNGVDAALRKDIEVAIRAQREAFLKIIDGLLNKCEGDETGIGCLMRASEAIRSDLPCESSAP